MLGKVAKVVGLVLGGLLVVVAVLFGILAVIAVNFSSGGCGGTLATGRCVTANSDGWSVTSRFSHDTATITTAGRTIVVAPTQLVVDGRAVAVVAEDAKLIDVTVRDGEVSFIADGRVVNRTR